MSCSRFISLLAAMALQCAAVGVHASSGSVSGQVRSATTLDPATGGSVALTINGVPWGTQAAIDGSGMFDFGTVTWIGSITATCQFQTSGTGFIDGGPSLQLQASGSLFADILLAPGSSISGVVTDSATNQPVSAGSVLIFASSGTLVGSAPVTAQGAYKYGGLVADTYYARTDVPDYLDELWDNIPCPKGNCTVSSGTPISVLGDEASSAVADFQLDRDLIYANGFEPAP